MSKPSVAAKLRIAASEAKGRGFDPRQPHQFHLSSPTSQAMQAMFAVQARALPPCGPGCCISAGRTASAIDSAVLTAFM